MAATGSLSRRLAALVEVQLQSNPEREGENTGRRRRVLFLCLSWCLCVRVTEVRRQSCCVQVDGGVWGSHPAPPRPSSSQARASVFEQATGPPGSPSSHLVFTLAHEDAKRQPGRG
jgi:hypothetical protein